MEYDFESLNEQQKTDDYITFSRDMEYELHEYTIGGGELFFLPHTFEHTPINRNILCFKP